MRVLALDTTTRAGSVALVDDNVIVEERPGDPSATHAKRLPAELLAASEAHGVALSAIDLFAIAAGPGSFTGLRIGLATIQGLAFGCARISCAAQAKGRGASRRLRCWRVPLGRMAVACARRGEAVDPDRVHPLYVRRPDAEIARGRPPLTTKDTKGTKENIVRSVHLCPRWFCLYGCLVDRACLVSHRY